MLLFAFPEIVAEIDLPVKFIYMKTNKLSTRLLTASIFTNVALLVNDFVSSPLHVRNVNIVVLDLRRAMHASDLRGILSTVNINNCDARETSKLSFFAYFSYRIP